KPAYEASLPRYQDDELVEPAGAEQLGDLPGSDDELDEAATGGVSVPAIDRTAKLYIGGAQKRPDANYSYPVIGAAGERVGEAPLGNRKDVRDAVEAAVKSTSWSTTTAHNRAQVIYYVAENLELRAPEFERRLRQLTGTGRRAAAREVELSVSRLFTYAAYADKYDGAVHPTPMRNVTLAMNEPFDVMAVVCPDEAPLLAFVSLVFPPLAMGNRVVAVPSARCPLAATDLYQVFETSDLPAGALNIVTGRRDELAAVLARHDAVEAMWYFGSAEGSALVERESSGNLKATWVNGGARRDWSNDEQAQGREFLRRSTRVKNVWVPYGE
ncbi:MAG TPA: aldehyde dehydrogenase family protein, partial [Trueperaceae bacterium]|nr:aldehyde dehydrogenase family protein [Trueperaceae bacterium]